jgi:hypothetical protein
MPVVTSRVAESGIVTQVFDPLNERALLNFPVVTQVPFETVPWFPLPDWSPADVPLASSKAQAPTRPGGLRF